MFPRSTLSYADSFVLRYCPTSKGTVETEKRSRLLTRLARLRGVTDSSFPNNYPASKIIAKGVDYQDTSLGVKRMIMRDTLGRQK